MKRVRPTLAVRCLGGQTEVFVFTDTAASVEREDDKHTVHVGFDNADDVAQQWLDSADHRELFAPDGAALARQIAGARRMKFRFTPFNASPVVVEFDVHGAEEPLQAVTKMCHPRAKRGKA
jgi:hypothetical protein